MIPAVPAHPAHHSSGPADHKKQPPTRSSGPFTRDLTHNPEPIRAPRSRHNPTLSRHQNTGPPLSKKNHSLHNGTISLAGTAYLVSRSRAGQEALITWDAHRTTITDPHGEAHFPSTRGRNREPGTPPTTAPPHAPPQETAPARTPETSPMP